MRSLLTLKSEENFDGSGIDKKDLKSEQALWKGIETINQFKIELCRLNKIVKTVTLDLVAFEQLTGKVFPKSGQRRLLY